MHVLWGLRYLERKKAGFAQVVVANMHQWEGAAAMSDKTITASMKRCASLGLIDHEAGQPLLKGAATQVRRRRIPEIETGVSDVKLRDYTPKTAREVVERLRGRTFFYGGAEVRPTVAASKTGRIHMSKPCPQNEPSDVRRSKILAGLGPGEYLIEADYRQAEPSVAREILTRGGVAPRDWPQDVYQSLASYLGHKRDEAKALVMAFMNAESSVAHAIKWGIRPGDFFSEFAKALDGYKAQLWERSTPRSGHRRRIHTLTRTPIEALKGERTHRGQLFQWQVQGTVADIMNGALVKILDGEQKYGWRFLFQVYDSVYVVTRDPRGREAIAEILRKEAKRLAICLQVRARSSK